MPCGIYMYGTSIAVSTHYSVLFCTSDRLPVDVCMRRRGVRSLVIQVAFSRCYMLETLLHRTGSAHDSTQYPLRCHLLAGHGARVIPVSCLGLRHGWPRFNQCRHACALANYQA